MSDLISNLPLNKYSNPTDDEIEIVENLFPEKKIDIFHIKLTIIICFIHIISILLNEGY